MSDTTTDASRYCPRCGRATEAALCPDDGSPTFQNGLRTDAAKAPEVGDIVGGRYRIQGILGQGGFGAVFAAEHLMTGQRVAVKVMLGDFTDGGQDLVQRFLQEARVTASLSHPNTVRIYDFGQTDEGVLFMAMEHLHGPTLESMLKDAGKAGTALSQQETVAIGVAVLRSLTEAHAAGLVHRDLKPGNLISVQIVGEAPVVKVLDFGIARAHNSNLTQTGTAMGTPTFMSPEQARGEKADGRSDLYSLGCILYACVAGQPPFVGDTTMSILLAHQLNALPNLQQTAKVPLSADFIACIARATAKKVGNRFESAVAMRIALEAVQPALEPPTSGSSPAIEASAPALEADIIADADSDETNTATNATNAANAHDVLAARRRASRAEVQAPTMAAVSVDRETATMESDVIPTLTPRKLQSARRAPVRSAPLAEVHASATLHTPLPRAPHRPPSAPVIADPDDLTPLPVAKAAPQPQPTGSQTLDPPASRKMPLTLIGVAAAVVVLGLGAWLGMRALAPKVASTARPTATSTTLAPDPSPMVAAEQKAAPAPEPALPVKAKPAPEPALPVKAEPAPEPAPEPEPRAEAEPAPEPVAKPEVDATVRKAKPPARKSPTKPAAPAKKAPKAKNKTFDLHDLQ